MLDLYYFQNPIEFPTSPIDEIPMDKLDVLVEKMGLIIKNMGNKKSVMIDEKTIIQFIESCGNKIISDLIKLNII